MQHSSYSSGFFVGTRCLKYWLTLFLLRKCPFKGEYVVFAGLDQVVAFLRSYSFSQSDVEYLRRIPSLQGCDPAFFDYLLTIDCSGIVNSIIGKLKICNLAFDFEGLVWMLYSGIVVSAVKEGTIVFPRVTLIAVSGPLIVGQVIIVCSNSDITLFDARSIF